VPAQDAATPLDGIVVGVSLDTYYSYNVNRPRTR
jgi:hypothetical protein